MARALALSLVLLSACGGTAEQPPSDLILAPSSNPATGLLTEIERDGDAIRALTLEIDGTTYRILIDPARDYGFDLSHLDEHLSETLPVRVSFETRSDGIYATAIDDA